MVEFRLKKECEEYATKMQLAFYQRDLNEKFAKIYIADTHEGIFNQILSGNNNFYETWNAHQALKLYIDYDKKEGSGNHINDLVNIINSITDLIQCKFTVYILKSYPDEDKKSYHIIFDGIHFSNYRNIKAFMEEKLQPLYSDLFSSHVIDTSVYSPICFRNLLCTKYGQNRPLLLLDTQVFMNDLTEKIIHDITIDIYKKTCLTVITPESILFSYKSEKKKTSTSKKVHLMNDADIYTDKEIIKKYLDILDPSRYSDRNKWLNIGYILHSISVDYYDIWHYFSMKWDSYSEVDCDIAWNSFNNGDIIHTVHNLIHLANKDNPTECAVLTKDIPDHDIKYLRPFDNVISKLIYRLYGQKFVCSNPEKNEWYHFNEFKWIKENKSYNLRKYMINDVFSKVEAYRRNLVKDCADEEIIKNYHYILKILGSGTKLNCLELEFYNSKFYKIIDQNKHLLGFENGVYDLSTMEFRASMSADYISMSTGYDFYVEGNNAIRKKLIKLISEILPNEETRRFTMKALSSCLDGYTVDENFYIFTGKNSTGGNGKSTLVDLTMKALGDYSYTAPITLFTAKRESSNNANSALAGIMNKRMIVMQEPEVNDVIQAGIMKGLTGGDQISTRELHSSQIEFKPHGKFIICCNKTPSISDIDGGVIRRLKITEFTSRFVDDPDNSKEDGIKEFAIDRTIKDKYDEYAPIFMNILLEYYVLYKSEGLVPPSDVIKVTKKYENDNNSIKYFIDENISKNKNGMISRDELKELYRNDFTIKNAFKKFGDFITQFENSLNVEFRMDKKNVYKIHGYSIKIDIVDTDEEETEFPL
jgi:P4 family phage/plasmid primase-like protien